MIEDRKEIILKEVGQLFLRSGIRSVTMDDICLELGISKKTLYQFFKDKEDLVRQVVDVFFMNNPDFRITHETGENAIDRVLNIRAHIVKTLRLIQNNVDFDLRKFYPRVYRKVLAFKRDKIYEDHFALMEQGKQEGLFREELDSDFISRLIVGRFLFIFNPDNGLFSEEEVRAIKLFDTAVDYHFHGICTEKGLEYFKQQLNNVQNEN
ncbi:TetR/AcrR family transcriptional regulator [Gaoshiqia sp. Z1-71]|uniref:TetR/AcrR family transcriptional regulator n=1 Tax=Gaoshiqia hydrogeniformans TaxID=3290090 RepID=UPI003BF7C956